MNDGHVNRCEGAVDFPTAANDEPFVLPSPIIAPIPVYPPRSSMHHIGMHLQPSSCTKQDKDVNANETPSHLNDVANMSLPPPRSRSPPPCPPPPPPSPTNVVDEVGYRQQLPPSRMGYSSAANPKRVAWHTKAATKLRALYSRLHAPCGRIFTGWTYGRDYRGLEIRVYMAYEQLQCDM